MRGGKVENVKKLECRKEIEENSETAPFEEPDSKGCATLYDGVGSVKRHLDCASRGARFFFFPERIFSLSCISTKARS
jgi:hypothetical protein